MFNFESKGQRTTTAQKLFHQQTTTDPYVPQQQWSTPGYNDVAAFPHHIKS